MHQFSNDLIEKTIKYFKEENGLDISFETANDYLHSLGSLYIAFLDE